MRAIEAAGQTVPHADSRAPAPNRAACAARSRAVSPPSTARSALPANGGGPERRGRRRCVARRHRHTRGCRRPEPAVRWRWRGLGTMRSASPGDTVARRPMTRSQSPSATARSRRVIAGRPARAGQVVGACSTTSRIASRSSARPSDWPKPPGLRSRAARSCACRLSASAAAARALSASASLLVEQKTTVENDERRARAQAGARLDVAGADRAGLDCLETTASSRDGQPTINTCLAGRPTSCADS